MVIAQPTDTPAAPTELPIATSTTISHLRELSIVGMSTAAALAVLRFVNTQIYTVPGTIDPWLYTAFMTHFDFAYLHFGNTYYASRLPVILPGLFLNAFLTPPQTYVAVHMVLFLAGGLFLYLLVRTIFGTRVAMMLYPAVLTNAIYVNAHSWDYFDGFVITYVSGGLYFLASWAGKWPRARLMLAGFLLTAATMANLFAALLVVGGLAAYSFVRWTTDRRGALARLATDGGWILIGASALLVSCGLFARDHGGRFLFFMPSIEAARAINLADYKLPGFGWMSGEPRLLVPGFLAAMLALTWRRSRAPESERFGLALAAAGIGTVLTLALWEFFGSGTFLQLEYYFDLLLPFLLVLLAAAVSALLTWQSRDVVKSYALLSGLGLFAGALPLMVVFGIRLRGGGPIVVALMGATLVLTCVLRLGLAPRRTSAIALLAVVLAIGSVSYASAANRTTQSKTANPELLADADEVFAIGIQLIDFMQRNGLEQDDLPAFWYDASRDASLISLQSLYFYGFTLVSTEMPIPDSVLRMRLEALRAKHIALLCAEPTCGGASAALRHAGYDAVPVAAQRLGAGSKSVWVEAYQLRS
jgi:hypothetical protein